MWQHNPGGTLEWPADGCKPSRRKRVCKEGDPEMFLDVFGAYCDPDVHSKATLCLQFIYDTWYASLTPDKEFPADVRRLLNNAFGNLAVRSRRLDLRAMLNDMSELLMEQVSFVLLW